MGLQFMCVKCNRFLLSSYIYIILCLYARQRHMSSFVSVFFSAVCVCVRGVRGLGIQGMCVNTKVRLWRAQPSRTVICRGGGPNYGVTEIQRAALSTADRTLLMGHAGAKEHGKTQGGLLNKWIIASSSLADQARLH